MRQPRDLGDGEGPAVFVSEVEDGEAEQWLVRANPCALAVCFSTIRLRPAKLKQAFWFKFAHKEHPGTVQASRVYRTRCQGESIMKDPLQSKLFKSLHRQFY